jgi:hypothetical protein
MCIISRNSLILYYINMDCFGICFGKPSKKADQDNPVNKNPLKKDTATRMINKASQNFYKATSFNSTEIKQHKEYNSSTLISTIKQAPDNQQALKKLTASSFRRTSFIGLQSNDSKLSDGNVITSPNKKGGTHWEAVDKLHCYFCGGENCKHENWLNHSNPAIAGLHSDFITSAVIASQRPSTVLINNFDLITEFKKLNVGLIVNVQREGEHPYCGPNKGLEEASGFSYDPHVFISEDIKVRRTGWKDMSVPDSMSFMLEIVKEMAVAIYEDQKKVLVHCHAGYGRTGVVIACYFIYVTNKPVEDIIAFIRQKRSGCVQKDSQYNYCQKFKFYVDKCRAIFGERKPVEVYMKNQNELLFGDELKKYEYIPKIISFIFETLENLLKQSKVSKEQIYKYLFYPENWSDEEESQIVKLKQKLNNGRWNILREKDIDAKVICQLVYDWLNDCVKFIINPDKVYLIFEEKGYSDVIEKHVKNTDQFKTEYKSLFLDIKSNLRTIESETLFCIAHFFNSIKPGRDTQASDVNNYILAGKRLCTALLGFNTFDSVENKETVERFVDYSSRLFNLVNFFALVLDNHLEDMVLNDKGTMSPYITLRKLQEGIKLSPIKDLKTPLKKDKQTIIKIKPSISKSTTSVLDKNANSDVVLYQVFKTLDGYFANSDKKEEFKLKSKLAHLSDKQVLKELSSILFDNNNNNATNNVVTGKSAKTLSSKTSENQVTSRSGRTIKEVTPRSLKEVLINDDFKVSTNKSLLKITTTAIISQQEKAQIEALKNDMQKVTATCEGTEIDSSFDSSNDENYKTVSVSNKPSQFNVNRKSILKTDIQVKTIISSDKINTSPKPRKTTTFVDVSNCSSHSDSSSS